MPFHLPHDGSGKRRSGPRETVALLAGLMALNALAIDAMIPALPNIGSDLGVATENLRQLVVVAYFLGFGVGQIFWGPLADRFGRKPILATESRLYAAFALLCGMAGSFELLIAGRIAMGASAAVTRVLVTAMVRDLFEGEEMARVMSLVFMVFMLVPMLAPNIGQAICWFADWRAIFLMLAGYGAAMWLWSFAKLPETLHPEYRRALHGGQIWQGIETAATDRLSIGYTLALTAVFGVLTGYIASIQQIVFDVFDSGGLIGLVFAAIAAPMVFSQLGQQQGGRPVRPPAHRPWRAVRVRCHDRVACAGRGVHQRAIMVVRRADGTDLRQLCLHDVELRNAGNDQYGADRGHRFLVPGSDRHDRRRNARAAHRPGVRWKPATLPDRLRDLRFRRSRSGPLDRARAAIRCDRAAGRTGTGGGSTPARSLI